MEVVQTEILDAVIEGVHGEVASLGILFDGAVHVVAQQHALIGLAGDVLAGIHLVVVAAEGGDFDDITTEDHMGQAEAAADQTTVGEQLFNLLRCGVGDDIKVFGRLAQ